MTQRKYLLLQYMYVNFRKKSFNLFVQPSYPVHFSITNKMNGRTVISNKIQSFNEKTFHHKTP